MKSGNIDLKYLREQFDLASCRARLKRSTSKRYQSWIKRYLIYCRALGLVLSQENALAFLRTYSSPNTQRQGYYAMQFLFKNVLEQECFFDLSDIQESKPRLSSRKRKWLKNFFTKDEYL